MTIPPLVASGGIIDIGSVIDSIAAGAEAVQLCSALDLRTLRTWRRMREELNIPRRSTTGRSPILAAAMRDDAPVCDIAKLSAKLGDSSSTNCSPYSGNAF